MTETQNAKKYIIVQNTNFMAKLLGVREDQVRVLVYFGIFDPNVDCSCCQQSTATSYS